MAINGTQKNLSPCIQSGKETTQSANFWPYYFQSYILFSRNIKVIKQYMALAGECLYFSVGT